MRDVRLIMDRNSRRSKGVGYDFFVYPIVHAILSLNGIFFFQQDSFVCMQLFFRFCSFCFFWFPFFYTPMLRDLPTLGNLSEEEFYDRIV